MTKTWETLFHLSSFMKYLLAEVLPDDKVDSSSYVIQSLHELLAVTSACIEKIKSEPKVNVRCQENYFNKSLEEVDQFRNCKSNEREEVFPNCLNNFSNTENHSEYKLTLSPKTGSVAESNEDVKEERNQSKGLPEKFVKLNDEMLNGRSLGHYCRPCDVVIYCRELWEKHLSYKIHFSLDDSCENKHISCSYCNLNIFASNADCEHLLDYHQQKHLEYKEEFERISNENSDGIECKNLEVITANGNETNSKKSISGNDFETFSNDKEKLDLEIKLILPTFVELDKQMHSGSKKGFYCYPCDKAYGSLRKWNKHFEMDKVHINQIEGSESFEKCESCELVIFATSYIQSIYKKYHRCGHENNEDKFSKNIQAGISCSLQNIHGILQDKNNQGHYSSLENIKMNKEQMSSSYYIIKSFRRFNSIVHSSNLHGCFYCRPCNAHFIDKEDWTKHSMEEKHLKLMESQKFKNWKGKCFYCFLTIVGTREAVKRYMEFHTEDHKQPVSYEEELIYSQVRKQSRLNSKSEKSSCSESNNKDGNIKQGVDMDGHYYRQINLSNRNKEVAVSTIALGLDKNEDEVALGFQDNTYKAKKKSKSQGKKKNSNIPSLSTLCNEGNNNEQTMEVDKVENTPVHFYANKPKAESNTEYISNDCSCDMTTEENIKQGFDSMVLQLINSRIEQKQKTGHPSFGALCLVCQITADNAFHWEDHLSFDQNHIQKISFKDCRASVAELNINLFGNSDLLMKYKSFVKGKMIFIDTK